MTASRSPLPSSFLRLPKFSFVLGNLRPHVAIESILIAALIAVLVTMLSNDRYDATLTLARAQRAGSPSPSAALAPPSAAILEAGRTSALRQESGKFRMEVLHDGRFRFLCSAPSAAAAERVCENAATATIARDPTLLVVEGHVSKSRLPTWLGIAAGLLAGFAWSWGSALRRNHAVAAAAALAENEPNALTTAPVIPIPPGSPDGVDVPTTARVQPRERLRRAAQGLRTLLGQPRFVRLYGTESDPVQRARGGVIVDPTAWIPESGIQAAWTGDPSTLTSDTLSQLHTVCEKLQRRPRETGMGIVIRVASDPSSAYAKTQVSAQLAWLLADRKDTQVLLLEGDPDSPALHTHLNIRAPQGTGLSEQIARLTLNQADQTLHVLRLRDNLRALVEADGGKPRLLDSPEFVRVLTQQRSEHHMIVVDGPVIADWPDTQSLHDIDGVVLVTQRGTDLEIAAQTASTHFRPEQILAVIETGSSPAA